MAYLIKLNGVGIETHDTIPSAERAFWILTAHELKHGRVANVELNKNTCDSVCYPSKVQPPLPPWACSVLAEHGFEGLL